MLDRLCNSVKNRDTVKILTPFSGGDPCDHIATVGRALPCVKTSLPAGDALDEEAGVLVDQYAHVSLFGGAEGGAVKTVRNALLLCEELHLQRRVRHAVRHLEIEARAGQDGAALFNVCSVKTHHYRNSYGHAL